MDVRAIEKLGLRVIASRFAQSLFVATQTLTKGAIFDVENVNKIGIADSSCVVNQLAQTEIWIKHPNLPELFQDRDDSRGVAHSNILTRLYKSPCSARVCVSLQDLCQQLS
jgi:hypothetical protein